MPITIQVKFQLDSLLRNSHLPLADQLRLLQGSFEGNGEAGYSVYAMRLQRSRKMSRQMRQELRQTKRQRKRELRFGRCYEVAGEQQSREFGSSKIEVKQL